MIYRLGEAGSGLTYHVVPPDVPLHGVVGVLCPAHPHIPQPGLAGEGPHSVQEHGGVEDEPPGALAELGGGGGQVSSPLVSEPSLNLHQTESSFPNTKTPPHQPLSQRGRTAWR